jgi:hypothetical protein
MLGFGFLNSLFLFALGAMALPIIIHILNRRRLRKVPFSSLEFIVELSRRRMSKINLRRWIILLLRTLAVVLLVTAFARPTVQRNAAFFLPGEAPKHVVICLDVSGSMGVERETGTVFTDAQRLAKTVVDESGSNDLLNVITFASRSDILFDTGTRNKQIVKNVIDDIEVTSERTSLQKAVEAAVSLIGKSELRYGEVYVVSDFRESADSAVVASLPDDIRVILVPAYREPVDNVSIDRVFTPRKLIRAGEVVRVGVAVTNHSRERPSNFPLELLVDGKRKAEKIVALAPASTATVNFAVSLNDWGTYQCRVSKDRDRLPVDDHRYFLLEVSQKVPVTLVRGRKFADDGKQAAAYFYVEKALNPRGSGEGEFAVKAIDEKAVTAANLPSKGVVVWTEPQTLDRNRFDLLKRYVHRGGAVMVFLGHDRRGFWRNEAFAQYLGMQKGTPRERAEGAGFVSFQKGHPIFSLFNDEELELLSRSRIRQYLSVTGVAPDSIIAYLGSGDPGIWECRRADGRILVVAATPDMPSGDLPLSPMFLPLVHTSVSYLASREGIDFHRENYAGAELYFDLPANWGGQGPSLRVMTGGVETERPVLYDSPQGQTSVMLPRPATVGFYRLMSDTTLVAEAAVNINTTESNLNPREFDASFMGGARLVNTSAGFVENLQRERQGREVYALFLLLAVSALVAEAILGRKA